MVNMNMFFDTKNTVYGGLKLYHHYDVGLSGGDQMMPQGIIRNSLCDASTHHQGVNNTSNIHYN